MSPGSRRNHVGGAHAGALKVAVTQRAEKGKANRAVLELLAEALDTRRSQLTLLAGGSSRRKAVGVAGLSAAALQRRLESLAARAPQSRGRPGS